MKHADPRLAVYGAAAILAGILVAIWVDAPAMRLLGSLTLIVTGFGLIRQALRIE
jgi:hypothetical protein